MNEDRIELVRQLCTQMGMIMEDASSTALLNSQTETFGDKIATLRIAINHAAALAAAAQALCGY